MAPFIREACTNFLLPRGFSAAVFRPSPTAATTLDPRLSTLDRGSAATFGCGGAAL